MRVASNPLRMRGPRLARCLAGLALLASVGAARGQCAGEASWPDGLSLERIMADPDWIGAAPESPRWSSDGASILFDRKIRGCVERDLVRLTLPDGSEHVVGDAERSAQRPWSGTLSRDGRLHAFVHDGDVRVEDLRAGWMRQLTRTSDDESALRFLSDGRRLAYRRGTDWFACDVASGLESPVALLRAEDDPRKPPDPTFLRSEQERLFDSVREERLAGDAAAQRDRERRAADPALPPAPLTFGKDQEIEDSSLSPNGRFLIVVLRAKEDEGKGKTIMTAHVTASGDTETRPVRPKVGIAPPVPERVMLVDLLTRETSDIALDPLPGITDDPLAALRPEEPRKEGRGHAKKDARTPRSVAVNAVEWTREGDRVALMFRSSDNKDRWIAELDFATKRLVPLHRLHDPAWVSWDFNEMGWLPRSGAMNSPEALWYLSEESGFSQIHLRANGKERARQLTFGRQCVSSVTATRDGRWLYFTANPVDPSVAEVHRVEAATGRGERVTSLSGQNAFVLSPDETQLLVTHSSALEPPELYLCDSAPGGLPRRLTHSTSAEFEAIAWTAPRFVDVPSRHGAGSIRARVVLPSCPAPEEGRSAVIFIHGAGYLQDAHAGWSSYFREFMFASLLAREGHVVIDPDYRASAGYGRAWRTAIHRDMGGPELDDLADCIEYLAAEHAVDRSRVGAWGGSYGGFLVLMAMFKRPEMLACGAALRPVTDWAHYNHPYTSNILETPDLAPDAYRRSSPIEWAGGLSRPLLLCAPMLDDNVLFQDTVRLVQRLIELEKPTFEVAIYPVEPHAFVRPSSWLDEYRRIHRLFTRHLAPPSKLR